MITKEEKITIRAICELVEDKEYPARHIILDYVQQLSDIPSWEWDEIIEKELKLARKKRRS